MSPRGAVGQGEAGGGVSRCGMAKDARVPVGAAGVRRGVFARSVLTADAASLRLASRWGVAWAPWYRRAPLPPAGPAELGKA